MQFAPKELCEKLVEMGCVGEGDCHYSTYLIDSPPCTTLVGVLVQLAEPPSEIHV